MKKEMKGVPYVSKFSVGNKTWANYYRLMVLILTEVIAGSST